MRPIGLTAIGTILAAAGAASAAETASATISDTGSGPFNYSITLHDTGTTTVGTFWYSWIPGFDFMKSSPTSVTPPSGWADQITGGGGSDGYAILFTANSSANYIASGGSLVFNFVSPDNFATMTGNSPTHPAYPIGTSYIYSAGEFSDGGDQFVVAAPEPASASLLGVAGVMVLKRRRR
jgi:hypothetical protein